MSQKKLMLILTDKGKKYAMLIVITLLIVISLNAVLFALFFSNSLEGKSVIIDPGHGGIDPGTNDAANFFEKDINLEISQKLCIELENNRCFTSLTRSDDRSLDSLISSNTGRHQKDLMARVEKFNNGAHDIFVSIHVNRSSNMQAAGPLVLYSPHSFENKFLAYCLQKKLNSHFKKTFGDELDRKPMQTSFYILKYSRIPGVIIESGFISNPIDKKKLTEGIYQEKLAKSISLGLKDYFGNVERAKAQGDAKGEFLEEESQPFNITNDIRLVEK